MGNNTKNIIVINGKRYDAVTGALLGAAEPAVHHSAPQHAKKQSVDGFRRVSRASIPSDEPLQPILKKIAEPVTTSTEHIVAVTRKHSPHAPASHANAHKPQPAKTLMRSAVTKPDVKSPLHIKAQTRTDILATVPTQLVVPKLSHGKIDSARLKRATRMIQSPAVSRYGHPSSAAAMVNEVSPQVSVAPKPEVVASVQPQTASKPMRTTPISHIPASVTQYGQPRGRSMDNFSRGPARPASHPAKKSTDIFEEAMAAATSHEQTFSDKKPKARKGKAFAKFATVTVSALLLIGFFGYQNLPNLNMKLASAKAGFSAKMPGYSPAGFSFGNLTYQPGTVNVSFNAKDGNGRFDISQKSSSWDSQALLNNFVVGASKDYQTYERAGRTVYLYGSNTATWVDNGVWYLIDGNSSLTRDQLIDVAISI